MWQREAPGTAGLGFERAETSTRTGGRSDGLLRRADGSFMITEVIDPIGGAQLDVVHSAVVDMSSTAARTADLGFSG
jgi:hypothetical protein